MRILVTGASGNVGTALLRRLSTEDVEVVGLARRPPAGPAGPAGPGAVRWHAVDLAADDAPERLRAALAGVDVVVHCAWRIQPSHDEAAMRAVNLGGTAALLGAMTAAARDAGAPAAHLVHLSSVGVYAPGPVDPRGRKRAVGESWPATGIAGSLYSRQKAEVERMLDAAQARADGTGGRGERSAPGGPASSGGDGGITVTRVRPGLVLQGDAGAEIARYFLGPLLPVGPLLRGLRRAHLPALPLPRALQVPVVHADDLADALWRSAQRRLVGGLNVAADHGLDADDLARAAGAARTTDLPLGVLRAAAGATWRLHLQPTDPGWVDLAAHAPLLRTERAREELGWAPRRGARDALEELLAAMAQGRGGRTPALRGRSATSGRMA